MAGERELSELFLFSAEEPGANEHAVSQDGETTTHARRALYSHRSFHQQVASIYPDTSLSGMIR